MADLASIPYQRSLALDWPALGNAGVNISERSNRGAVLLKASHRTDMTSFRTRGPDARLPEPNTWLLRGDVLWLWQGPREWLLISGTMDGKVLAEQAAHVATGMTAAAIDVCDRLFMLDISGPAASTLFAKGTSLDPTQLAPGGCCCTRFAALQATVLNTGADGSFGLLTDRATSLYLYAWFRRAISDIAPLR